MRWSKLERILAASLAVLLITLLSRWGVTTRGSSGLELLPTEPPPDSIEMKKRREEIHVHTKLLETVQNSNPVTQMVDVIIIRGYGKPRGPELKPKVQRTCCRSFILCNLFQTKF